MSQTLSKDPSSLEAQLWVQQERIAPSPLGGGGRQGHRCKIRDSCKISLQASNTGGPAVRGGRHRFRFSWCDETGLCSLALNSGPISALKGSLECASPSFLECDFTRVTVGMDYRQLVIQQLPPNHLSLRGSHPQRNVR